MRRLTARLKRGAKPDLERLSPRQRAMVEVIYTSAGATLREIHERIPDSPPSICGLRTQLNRLVRRGILTSRRSGHHSEVIYLPVGSWPELQRRALERIAAEQFHGSLKDAVHELMRLAAYESPQA